MVRHSTGTVNAGQHYHHNKNERAVSTCLTTDWTSMLAQSWTQSDYCVLHALTHYILVFFVLLRQRTKACWLYQEIITECFRDNGRVNGVHISLFSNGTLYLLHFVSYFVFGHIKNTHLVVILNIASKIKFTVPHLCKHAHMQKERHTHKNFSPLAYCNSCSWPFATQLQMLLTHLQESYGDNFTRTPTARHRHAHILVHTKTQARF